MRILAVVVLTAIACYGQMPQGEGASSASGFSNPMTGAGDMIYRSATGTVRLPAPSALSLCILSVDDGAGHKVPAWSACPGGGMADPGANGIIKRTAVNTTAAAVAGTDYQAPITAGTIGQYLRGDLSLATFPSLGSAASQNVGTTSGTVAAGDDARLTNARTPSAHAASHALGQVDALTIAESQVTGLGADMGNKANVAGTIITDATTARTLSASDNGAIIVFSSGSAITVTAPVLTAGFNCLLVQRGAGTIKVTASSTTLYSEGSKVQSNAQNAPVTVLYTATTDVQLGGSLK